MTQVSALTGNGAVRPSTARHALSVLVRTGDDWLPVIARVGLGAVMLPHGAQKAFGWFGGGGVSGTIDYFAAALQVPAPLTLLVIAAELLGSLALLAGFMTRAAAASVGAVMIGAVLLVHAPAGFFMNWAGTQAGEGFEYHLLALALVAILVRAGAGRASLDRTLGERLGQ